MPAPLIPLLARLLPMLARGAASTVSSFFGRGGASAARGGLTGRSFGRFAARQLVRFRRAGRTFGRLTGGNVGSRIFKASRSYERFNQARQSLELARNRYRQWKQSNLAAGGNPQAPNPFSQDLADANRRYAEARANVNQSLQGVAVSLTRLGSSVGGSVLALVGFTVAVKKAGDANVEAIRARSPFSGRIASAVARFDAQEIRRSFRSAAATSASSERFLKAQNRLNDATRPLSDFAANVTNDLLTSLVGKAAGLTKVMSDTLQWLQVNAPGAVKNAKDAGIAAVGGIGNGLAAPGVAAGMKLGVNLAGGKAKENGPNPAAPIQDNRMPLDRAIANQRWAPPKQVPGVK